ncbi:MAG TPA: TolC family protein [Thermoanaerobaculia bacterium]
MNDERTCSFRSWLLALLGVAFSSLSLAQAPAPEPLTVRRAAELALERAPQLAAVRAAHEEGSASARVASDSFNPSIWAITTPGYASGLPVAVAGRVPSYAGVELRQTIYDPWRKTEALQAQASATHLEGTLEISCVETVQAVVTVYAKCWADERRADSAARRLSAAEGTLKRISSLFEEGRRTELDVERARLQAARAKQKLLNAESDRDLEGLELKRMIGWPVSAPLRLAGEIENALPQITSAESLAAARDTDPRLKSLWQEIELLGRSARLTSKRWPIIEASAQYQRLPSYYDKYYKSFNENDLSIGVSVAIPIWAGGRLDDTEARAKASVARVQAERDARESELEVAVRRAEAAVARADAERSLTRRSQGIAEQDLSSAKLLSREGRGEAGDVDDRQMALADADEEAARASLDALEQRVRLLALRGELARSILGSEPPCAAR